VVSGIREAGLKEFYKATITPNRSNPRRFMRLVAYRRTHNAVRGVDVVEPYLYQDVDGRVSVDRLQYRDIRPYPADSEFAEAWAEHVRAQLG
jgi:hypothetical protein